MNFLLTSNTVPFKNCDFVTNYIYGSFLIHIINKNKYTEITLVITQALLLSGIKISYGSEFNNVKVSLVIK